jgi:hypothetical protein
MTQKNSIKPLVDALQEMFSRVNQRFCGLELPDCVISVAPAGRKSAYAWFCLAAWTRGKEENPDYIPEINLAAEHLARGKLAACESLIHEMVHYRNFSEGIRDCSSNQYHNIKFKKRCEEFGLSCELVSKYGYAQTSLSDSLREWCETEFADIPDEVFELARLPETIDPKTGKKKGKAPTKMRKWTCGCTNVRCAVQLDASCDRCGNVFEPADLAKENN